MTIVIERNKVTIDVHNAGLYPLVLKRNTSKSVEPLTKGKCPQNRDQFFNIRFTCCFCNIYADIVLNVGQCDINQPLMCCRNEQVRMSRMYFRSKLNSCQVPRAARYIGVFISTQFRILRCCLPDYIGFYTYNAILHINQL